MRLFTSTQALPPAASLLFVFHGQPPVHSFQVAHATQGPPLLHAAAWGETEIVEALLLAGASLHARDCADFTALHYASVGGHISSAVALLKAGADTTSVNEDGHTPLDLASGEGMIEVLKHRGLPQSELLKRRMSPTHCSSPPMFCCPASLFLPLPFSSPLLPPLQLQFCLLFGSRPVLVILKDETPSRCLATVAQFPVEPE